MTRINGTRTPTQSQQGISLDKFEPQDDLSSRESVTRPSQLATHSAGRWTPPFMPWFETDFQGSLRVRQLHRFAKWIYGDLLRAEWHCDTAPYLPNNEEQLRVICDCPTGLWKKHGPAVMRCFTPTPDGKLLYHQKVVKEFNRALLQHERKVAGGNSRWGKQITEASAIHVHTHEHNEVHLHQAAPRKAGASE